MIRVYVWQATKEELEVLHKLINVTLGEKSARQIYDLSNNNQDINAYSEDVIIACGMRCYNIVSASLSGHLVHRLPTLKQLLPKPENQTYRKSAFKYLTDLSKNGVLGNVSSTVELSAEELKQFTLPLLKKLEETLKEKKIEYWKGRTDSGKTIAITLRPNITIQGCDIVLTFEEIVAAKIAIELLNLDLLTLVPGEDK